MASLVSTGSPKSSRKSTPTIKVLDQGDDTANTPTNDFNVLQPAQTFKGTPSPLQSSKLGNLQQVRRNEKMEEKGDASGMGEILARLRMNDSRKPSPIHTQPVMTKPEPNALDKLLTNLNGKNITLKKQEMDLKDESESDTHRDEDHSSGSDLFTPATESFEAISHEETLGAGSVRMDVSEMLRVKQELAAAKSVITRQEQELAETRNLKHTIDQAMGPPSEIDFGNHNDISEQTIGHLQSAFNASARPFTSRSDTWQDSRSDSSEALSAGGFNRGRGIWNNPAQPQYMNLNGIVGSGAAMHMYSNPRDAQIPTQVYNQPYGNHVTSVEGTFAPSQRVFSNQSTISHGFDSRLGADLPQPSQSGGLRKSMNHFNRSSSTFSDRSGAFGAYAPNLQSINPAPISPIGIPAPYGYQPRPIGPPISPTSSDYGTGMAQGLGTHWPQVNPLSAALETEVDSVQVPGVNGQTYVTPLEPMNYRRLLDKSVSCDWKYIVDKIVCSNDQQASIFLQQKLKVGTAEQKFDIVESIVNQAYPLMINRFGNFLVQRCFEHGTPDQVVSIANAIHGNVLSLSMDAFGCHVIQKAFDSVPENHKADMVRELLRRIPDTVIHRYACHVWQKLFELRWSGEPPQIMLKVNEALKNMWHEVALGETGSLVVQNIFENCVEDEKRPAIEEVIRNIDLIAHGQFGNWCIQHLCEHGSPPDKRRVIDHILANSYSYSIDQFASKVVEKCLKIGGVEFLDRYLTVICTAHPDRPRIPLIDIAGDQYGNYLIQWILMNTHHHQREQVAIHIRKHMVSLRGSKFGSRVAMLCCNPASATRPGPGVVVNPFGAPGQPRGWGRFL